MPVETKVAIEWSLGKEKIYEEVGFRIIISWNTPSELVDKVREYFNLNDIEYSSFSYSDLVAVYNG